MKHSIFKRFAIVSILAFVVGTVASLLLSINYNSNEVFKECQGKAQIALSEAKAALNGESYDEIIASDSSKTYQSIRETLRTICELVKLKYIYVFVVDQQTGEQTYLFVVASNDEDDEFVLHSRPLGSKSNYELSNQELDALKGKEISTRETVNNEYGHVSSWYASYEIEGSKNPVLIGADINESEIEKSLFHNTLAFAVPMVIVISGIIVLEVVYLKRGVSNPLHEVSEHMRLYTENGIHDDEPLRLGHDDEIAEISNSFNQMTKNIENYVDRISEMTEERVQAATELDIARRIQQGIVPPVTHLQRPDYDAYAFMRTARAVGGDFYDIATLDDDKLLIVMADVSGKGVSAALFMAMGKTLLRDKLQSAPDPATALNEVNDIIEKNNPANMFVTVLAGVFDPSSRTLTYANAGHMPPLIIGRGYEDPDPGIAIGLFEDAGIVNNTITLAPGEGILFYTDGATEAIDINNKFFGEGRLAEAVADAQNPQDAIKAAVDAIDIFGTGHEQFDDLTLLSLFSRGDNDG